MKENITKEREIVFILRPAWLLKTSRILFSISDCNRRLSVYLCSATFLPSCNPPTSFWTWPTDRVVQSVLSSGFQPPNMDTFHMPCDKRLSTVAPRLLGSWRTLPLSRLFTLNTDKHCDNVPQRKSNHLHNGRIVCQLMPIPTVSVLG